MQHVKNSYQKEFKKYGRDSKSLFIPKNNQEVRFKSLTKHIKNEKFTLLDFGCGLGDLKDFLDFRFNDYMYTGVDIVEEFIQSNKDVDKESEYFKIETYKDIDEKYDYIVIAGVFNILYRDSIEEHKNIVYNTIEYLFSKTKKALSINFMSDYVDFKQETAYHQDDIELMTFLREKLSSRFIIDNSYMPYEFSVIVYKDKSINQKMSVYCENIR